MAATDPLDAFYLALDEAPGDTVTTLALADWYEEHGQETAATCVRWALQQRRWPFRYLRGAVQVEVPSEDWHNGWYWWVLETPFSWRGFPPECCLPQAVWDRLPHSFDYTPAVLKQYPSRRAAYQALFVAWRAGPTRDRE
jgi:uncharacterized protein (TIGR02996 family)